MKEKLLLIEELKAEFHGLKVTVKDDEIRTQFCFESSYFVSIPVVELGGKSVNILSLSDGSFYAVVTIHKDCMFG